LKLTFSYERKPIPHQINQRDNDNDDVDNDEDEYDDVDFVVETDENGYVKEGMEEDERKNVRDVRTVKNNQMQRNESIKNREETGTHITYSIHLARDFGPKELLISIDVIASGEGPSAQPAIPMDQDIDNDYDDDNDDIDNTHTSNQTDTEISMMVDDVDDKSGGPQYVSSCMASVNSNNQNRGGPSIVPDGKDRFAAFVEPNTLLNFVSWTQLKIDDAHSLFFLMSFIFYEHEWDLVGFLMDSVFADDS